MSLLSKVRMSPSEDKQNGDISAHEQQRDQALGSYAQAGEETNAPARSWDNPELERAADQTFAQSLPLLGSGRPDLETTRTEE